MPRDPHDPHDRPPPSLGTVRPAQGQGPASQRGATAPPTLTPPPPPPLAPQFRGPQMMYRKPSRGLGSGKSPPERGGGGGGGSRFGKIVLFSLLGLVALAGAGGALLLLAPPTGIIRDRLAAEVKQRTGRDLAIGGKPSLTFYPALGVKLTDVSLSAPPSMPGAPLLVAESIEVQVALLPLVTREVTIERLVLNRPTIDLRVDALGRRSWDFADAEMLRQAWPPRYAQAARPPTGSPVSKELQDFARNTGDRTARGKQFSGLNDLSLSDVRIIDGTLRYTDIRQGSREELTALHARISLKQLAGPLSVTGSFVKSGERVAVETNVEAFKDMLEERPSKVTLKIAARPLSGTYDGTIAAGLITALDGRLSLKAPSLDALAQFAGVPLGGAEALGALAVDGQLKVNGPVLALSGANLALGETAATGVIAIDTNGARPQVKANLKFAHLDLNRFSGVEPKLAPMPLKEESTAQPSGSAGRFAPSPGGTGTGGTVPAPTAQMPAAKSIEDLIDQTDRAPPLKPSKSAVPQVRGFAQRDGWSSEAINLTALRLVDVEGRVDFGSITQGNVKVGQTISALQLKNGFLKLEITEAALYGGKAKGLINLDARQQELALGANISSDGVAAGTLLKDAADIDMVEGRGRLVIAVSARGGSERELIGTLAGKAELQMVNGAIVGWDAAQMLAGLGQGRIPKLDRQTTAKTPFSELSGTFQIANGVARNQDLKFESPAIRSTGSGVINLVDRNIDMTLRPRQTQAAVGGLSFDVPIRIAGPWSQVAVMPELGNAMKSPQAQEAVKKLKEGDVDGAVRGVLGGGAKADEKIGKAKDALKQLLGR